MEQQISGHYQRVDSESTNCTGICNLRIDIDGEHPLHVISGDMANSTDSQSKFGSFRFTVNDKIERGETLELKCNHGIFYTYTNSELIGEIQIDVPLGERSRDILVHWINRSGDNVTGVFKKRSPYFRSLSIEHFYEEGAEPLCTIDTEALDCPSHRVKPLSLEDAFAEARIELKQKEGPIIAHPKSEDSKWTAEELQAMHIPPSNATPPQGSIWLLSALEYVINTVKGLRLVNTETARIGCVVFQNATGWQTPEEKRIRLFIYMHELGHCLNLKHPWEQIGSAGYSTLSWMNYPWRYSHSEQEYGSEAFWRKFNFEFSDFELLKLRHGF